MTSTSRSLWLAALVLCGIVALSACEDAETVDPKDRRFAVGTAVSTVCPVDAAHLKEGDIEGKGSAKFFATVFGTDGTPVPNVVVNFSTTAAGATFDSTQQTTDAFGRASVTATSGRPAGENLVVTATTDTGLTATATLPFPRTPIVGLGGFASNTTVGKEFEVAVGITSACNIQAIEDAELTYDASLVEFVGKGDVATWNAFNDNDSDGTPDTPDPNWLTLDGVSTPGRVVDITYDPDDVGFTKSSNLTATYFTIKFKAIAAGTANFKLEAATLRATQPPGTTYPIDLDAGDRTFGILINAPPPASR